MPLRFLEPVALTAVLYPLEQMMRPVHDKVKTLYQFVFRDPVEQVSMQEILCQCPEKQGKKEYANEL